MTFCPWLHYGALCHLYPTMPVEIGSVCLIGDLNNEGPLRYGQWVLLQSEFKLSQLVNIYMYMLHEVTSCTRGDSLDTIIQKITIRSKTKVHATLYEQLRGTTYVTQTYRHGFKVIREHYDKLLVPHLSWPQFVHRFIKSICCMLCYVNKYIKVRKSICYIIGHCRKTDAKITFYHRHIATQEPNEGLIYIKPIIRNITVCSIQPSTMHIKTVCAKQKVNIIYCNIDADEGWPRQYPWLWTWVLGKEVRWLFIGLSDKQGSLMLLMESTESPEY
jgi:hypothetical protein